MHKCDNCTKNIKLKENKQKIQCVRRNKKRTNIKIVKFLAENKDKFFSAIGHLNYVTWDFARLKWNLSEFIVRKSVTLPKLSISCPDVFSSELSQINEVDWWQRLNIHGHQTNNLRSYLSILIFQVINCIFIF